MMDLATEPLPPEHLLPRPDDQPGEPLLGPLLAGSDVFRLLVESVKDYAIFMLDPEGRVATWNPGAEHIKGYRAEEVLGSHFSRFYTPEDVAEGRPELALEQAATQGRVEDEGWRVRKDGTRFWAHAVITALRDGDGQLQGFAKVTRDLTQQRLVEETSRRLIREEAAREAAERHVARLREVEAQLQEAVRVRDEFLSIASHELKTPLTPLQLKLQVLLREASAPDAPAIPASRVSEALATIRRQVERLNLLINDLLDVSRISAGRLTLLPEPMDLATLLREVVGRFAHQAHQSSTPLVLHVPDTLEGTWDRMRLEQVVTNLLSNALKYGPGKPVHVHLEAADGGVRLVVRDHGIGIHPDSLSRIFGRFERAVSERNYGGLGLGLYIAQRIVRAMGGTIEAQSQPGQGSTFTVRLPLAAPPA